MAANVANVTGGPVADGGKIPTCLIVSVERSPKNKAICNVIKRALRSAAGPSGASFSVQCAGPPPTTASDPTKAAQMAQAHVAKHDKNIAVIVGGDWVEHPADRCFQPHTNPRWLDKSFAVLQQIATAAGAESAVDQSVRGSLLEALSTPVLPKRDAGKQRTGRAAAAPSDTPAETPRRILQRGEQISTVPTAGAAATAPATPSSGSSSSPTRRELDWPSLVACLQAMGFNVPAMSATALTATRTSTPATAPGSTPTPPAPTGADSASGTGTGSRSWEGSGPQAQRAWADVASGRPQRDSRPNAAHGGGTVSSTGGSTTGIAGSGNSSSSNTVHININGLPANKPHANAQRGRASVGQRRGNRRNGKQSGGTRGQTPVAKAPATPATTAVNAAKGSGGAAAKGTASSNNASAAGKQATGKSGVGGQGTASALASAPTAPPAPTAATPPATATNWASTADERLAEAEKELERGTLAATTPMLAAIQAWHRRQKIWSAHEDATRTALLADGLVPVAVSGAGKNHCQGNAVSAALTGSEHLGQVLRQVAQQAAKHLTSLACYDQTKLQPLLDELLGTFGSHTTLSTEQLARQKWSGLSLGSTTMTDSAALFGMSMGLGGARIRVGVRMQGTGGSTVVNHVSTVCVPCAKADGTWAPVPGTIDLIYEGGHYSAVVSSSSTPSASNLHGPAHFDADLLASYRSMSPQGFRTHLQRNVDSTLAHMSRLICGEATPELDGQRAAVLERRANELHAALQPGDGREYDEKQIEKLRSRAATFRRAADKRKPADAKAAAAAADDSAHSSIESDDAAASVGMTQEDSQAAPQGTGSGTGSGADMLEGHGESGSSSTSEASHQAAHQAPLTAASSGDCATGAGSSGGGGANTGSRRPSTSGPPDGGQQTGMTRSHANAGNGHRSSAPSASETPASSDATSISQRTRSMGGSSRQPSRSPSVEPAGDTDGAATAGKPPTAGRRRA